MADAINGPMPGTVISWRATSFFWRTWHSRRRAFRSTPQGVPESRSEPAGQLSFRRADYFPDLRRWRSALTHWTPPGHALSELGQVTPQGVDHLRVLPDQKLADPEDHRGTLRLLTLRLHDAYGRALRRFTDRLSIGRIILQQFDEMLRVGRRDQPNFLAQLTDLSARVMCATVGFQRHDTRWQRREKLKDKQPPLLPKYRPASTVKSMRLKHNLRQIEPSRHKLHHDRSLLWIHTNPPWHIDAVEGRSHRQSLAECQRHHRS